MIAAEEIGESKDLLRLANQVEAWRRSRLTLETLRCKGASRRNRLLPGSELIAKETYNSILRFFGN